MATIDTRHDERAERLTAGELAKLGALIAITAIALNLLVLLVFTSLFTIDDDFTPMSPGPIVIMTVLGTTAALLVFAVIQRFASRPLRVFQIVAVVALLISLIPNIGLLAGDPAQEELQGANGPAVIGLMLMHVIVAGLVIAMLTRRLGRG